MVRPIEISDSRSKSEAVQRIQQNQKVQPEAVQQFQKTLNEKLSLQVTITNPVPKGDQVVLHVDEQEEEKRKSIEDQERESHEHSEENADEQEKKENEDIPPHDHIDFKA